MPKIGFKSVQLPQNSDILMHFVKLRQWPAELALRLLQVLWPRLVRPAGERNHILRGCSMVKMQLSSKF